MFPNGYTLIYLKNLTKIVGATTLAFNPWNFTSNNNFSVQPIQTYYNIDLSSPPSFPLPTYTNATLSFTLPGTQNIPAGNLNITIQGGNYISTSSEYRPIFQVGGNNILSSVPISYDINNVPIDFIQIYNSNNELEWSSI